MGPFGGAAAASIVSPMGLNSAGPQVFRVVMDTNGARGDIANMNWLKVR